jgi:predicted O-methyltransferase YrrM
LTAAGRQAKGRHPLCKRAREFAALQRLPELSQLLWEVEDEAPEAVLEIGTYAGGTLYCWCRLAAPDAVIVSIDLPEGRFGGGCTEERAEEMRLLFPRERQRLHLIRGDSHSPESLAELERHLDGRKLDFAFIDGDHTYDGVKRDFEMYSPLIRDGGLIAFHDICEHPDEEAQVHVFWSEIKHSFRHEEIVAATGAGGGIGLLWNEPPKGG